MVHTVTCERPVTLPVHARPILQYHYMIGPVKFGVAGRENRRARLMELVFSEVVVARPFFQKHCKIDWKEYFDDAMQHRSKKIKPDYEMVVVYAPGYLKDLSSLIMNLNNTNENNIVLNNYLVWQTVRSLTGYLSKAFRDAYKGLRKALVGSEGGEESWRYCVSDTNNVIGFAIGAMFVREVFHGNSKPMAEDMINEIREAFKRNLKMLSWMDQETREAAERKADAITDMIGGQSLPQFRRSSVHTYAIFGIRGRTALKSSWMCGSLLPLCGTRVRSLTLKSWTQPSTVNIRSMGKVATMQVVLLETEWWSHQAVW
uniref:Peptidase M13 N-terminal domain-containing protein n=1 Tax=Timema bartmani TaxID=61472 RepID=A0A7R9F8B7_9NEOP|nr:unnamed protein product [Timema bartmani]